MNGISKTLIAALLFSATLPLASARADDNAPGDHMRERWQNMTEEERAQWKAQRKERFESMSPQEKTEKFERRQERFKNMTDEQKEAFRNRHGHHGDDAPDGQ